ncbi:SLC13 family permease [Kytococcus sedentarius]|uniref:Na+/H+ antiporter NhaD-like permease n=1 Tax=Kytococcus sedentarius (strain ATCC 14392 / DSM 20547 / JCM 11482 / CCUG 33030 / NBRC 15357 / NCTC 11040 / CCM 314 / 541) TaxID=478801 RepID=C7NL95_KYTSD|nr:SLC13 family permease [Kytococcus sedentarius]ACV05637.1 Na+/H+ antiporter NhaD-like permease [Kytococcus sedentarius DSM 20547]QQB64061.1 SLC13 family permease [Kytococcus sedentarius]STX12947.1 transporter, divalent anion:Na+ symporter (DASS) family [Kytococcus sedentarius]
MSHEIIALAVLAIVFLIATLRGVNMGALALVASFIVGLSVYGVSVDDVLSGFPADLFVILVGVTYLFALAKNNGTVDWIVHSAVRAVGGRVALVPWAMFLVCAAVTAMGAVSPAAVAIVAPVAMGFALRYQIHPLMMGMMVVQGATAGSFSPIGIFGSITNGVVEGNGIPGNQLVLFLTTFFASAAIAALAYVAFGGRQLVARGREPIAVGGFVDEGPTPWSEKRSGEPHSAVEARRSTEQEQEAAQATRLDAQRSLTLVGMLALLVGALGFDLDVGFTALTIAVALTLVFPASAKGAVEKISWGTVLLIGGIVTYVTLLQNQGVVDWLGDGVANVGAPLVAALLICFIGAVVSAFASTTGIIGALIPLAVPFLLTDQVSAIGLIAALAISSSVVDCSPFSTNGALVVANAEPEQREMVFKRLMQWGMSIVVVAPLVAWAVLVVPTV